MSALPRTRTKWPQQLHFRLLRRSQAKSFLLYGSAAKPLFKGRWFRALKNFSWRYALAATVLLSPFDLLASLGMDVLASSARLCQTR